MKLNQTQLDIIKLYQSQINSSRNEAAIVQSKLDAFITGVVSSNGVSGKVTYDIQGDELVITVPPLPEPIEE